MSYPEGTKYHCRRCGADFKQVRADNPHRCIMCGHTEYCGGKAIIKVRGAP